MTSQPQVHCLRVAADRVLTTAFALGQPLQTTSPFHSLLILHGIPDSFTTDDNSVATHLLHNTILCLEGRNPVSLALKVTEFVQHKTCFVERFPIVSPARNTGSWLVPGTRITQRELTIRQPDIRQASYFSRTHSLGR